MRPVALHFGTSNHGTAGSTCWSQGLRPEEEQNGPTRGRSWTLAFCAQDAAAQASTLTSTTFQAAPSGAAGCVRSAELGLGRGGAGTGRGGGRGGRRKDKDGGGGGAAEYDGGRGGGSGGCGGSGGRGRGEQ
jgi:hypothetical protein